MKEDLWCVVNMGGGDLRTGYVRDVCDNNVKAFFGEGAYHNLLGVFDNAWTARKAMDAIIFAKLEGDNGSNPTAA